MKPSPSVRSRRVQRSLSRLLAAVAILIAGVAFVSRPGRAADDWELRVTADPTVVVAGSSVTFTLSVAASDHDRATADLEIFDPTGTKVFQDAWEGEWFRTRTEQTYTTTWDVPDDAIPGEYFVKAGVFDVGWTRLESWTDDAGDLTIVASDAPPAPTTSVTTAPPTTRPPTTTPPPTTGAPTTTPPPATTVRPTTTLPAATTTSPRPATTIAPPSTTAPTTAPPSQQGTQFSATFETEADFTSRFVRHVGNQCTLDMSCRPENQGSGSGAITSWNGDHDLSCGAPTTTRRVNAANHSEFFWWCAPGNDASKGHVMTAVNTVQYNIVSFSPDRSFTDVARVCWDINMTEEGGGKWTNVILVPASEYARHPNDPKFVGGTSGEGAYRLDYTSVGFNQNGGPGDFNIQDDDMAPGNAIFGLRNMRGALTLFRGDNVLWHDGRVITVADKAARYQHCIEDTAAGVRITRALPPEYGGRTESMLASGVHFPDGQVRVIFQDDNYDPPKREAYSPDRLTWHWDNIQIS